MLHLSNTNIGDLDALANKHFDRVYDKIRENLKKQKKALTKSAEDAKRSRLYKFLYQKEVLTEVIKGTPAVLERVIDAVSLFDVKLKEKKDKDKKKEQEPLLKIFSYSDYDWEPYQLATDLGITSCCYCNRQYTIVVGDDKKKGTRPQFDHFFPKSRFPYLALSFYNLIPSCSVCNSSLKGADDVALGTHVHPYIEGFEEETRFTTVPSCYEDIVGAMPPEQNAQKRMQVIFRQLSEDEELKKRIQGNINLFRLEEVYTEHADYIRGLIRLKVISNAAYMKDIAKLYDGLFDGEEELYRLIFGNYLQKEEFSKRPMAKLSRDILEGLGVYQDK